MRKKTLLVVAAVSLLNAALLAGGATAAPAATVSGGSGSDDLPGNIPALAGVPRDAVSISGTVQGRGGAGKYAWTAVLSGAKVWVPGHSATVTTNALGAYSLVADIPNDPYADYAIRATRTSYDRRDLPVSTDSPQTRNFVGANALLVKGTTLRITVLRAGRTVRGATVSCFGKSVKSNTAGRATLTKLRLRPGVRYKATVAKRGFHRATVSFTSRPGNTVAKSVTIHK
jgi:hypothetical protein